MMARQVRLSRRDFLNLVDCPLTLDEYLKLLRPALLDENPTPASEMPPIHRIAEPG
jgi:hypothetical protein